MPTRAQVGRPDGVTNASITPLTSSTATSPSATVPAVRPSRAMAWDAGQVAGFDPRPEQPEADAAGDEDGRQLEQAVRQDQPPEQLAAVVAHHDRPDDRQVGDVVEEHLHQRQAEDAQAQAQRGDPGVVDPDLRGEVAGGVLAVVALEVVVDQLVDLGRARAGSARRWGGRAATTSSRAATTTLAARQPSHQNRSRYRAAGNRSVKKQRHPAPGARPGCRPSGCGPGPASEDRWATRVGSGAAERSTERWVATCW